MARGPLDTVRNPSAAITTRYPAPDDKSRLLTAYPLLAPSSLPRPRPPRLRLSTAAKESFCAPSAPETSPPFDTPSLPTQTPCTTPIDVGALPYTTPLTLDNPRLPSPSSPPDPPSAPSAPATATDTPLLTPRNTWPRAPHFDLGLSRRARRPLLPRGHALSSRIRRGPRQIRKRSRTSRRRRPPLVAHRALVRRTMGHARRPRDALTPATSPL